MSPISFSMIQRSFVKWITLSLTWLLLFVITSSGRSQGVYERGTFVTIPAGKHVNHSYSGMWNSYFAVEDGVLVYDHHQDTWLDPITASDGLQQYPVLLVWQDQGTQDVWMITPDYVFVYDELSGWMSHASLPKDARFSGNYTLGVSPRYVIVTAEKEDSLATYSALFLKSAGTMETWGEKSELDINWDEVHYINTFDENLAPVYSSFPVQLVQNGGFDADGNLHLDGYPRKSATAVSALTSSASPSRVFLSTYGMGVFYQKIPGGIFSALPFGLLSPDVMCLKQNGDQLILGGRAGLTFLSDVQVSYDEAIRDPVFDYSFVSAVEPHESDLFIAARGGIFKRAGQQSSWNRLLTKKDLASKRIYSIAAGNDGNLMIATERNAYLYHESGLLLQNIFPADMDWPVFDIEYSDGKYYLSTYYGLFVYDELGQNFLGRINSQGDLDLPGQDAVIDPIYKSVLNGDFLWASTHRGLIKVDLINKSGKAFLAPSAPFRPRGLARVGHRLWIGTDNGLYSFESDAATWRNYSRNDGLVSNFVTDLAADTNYIWLGTNLGLTRIKWRNLY